MSGLNDGLRLCLLGRFELRADERLLIGRGWRRTKSKALLKLLGLQQGRALHRERAMELLWPHLEPAAAANQLYQSRRPAGARRRGAADPAARRSAP
jgi:DNA-binding SARP family transcriptional activator